MKVELILPSPRKSRARSDFDASVRLFGLKPACHVASLALQSLETLATRNIRKLRTLDPTFGKRSQSRLKKL